MLSVRSVNKESLQQTNETIEREGVSIYQTGD
jgi:hypothetical protein